MPDSVPTPDSLRTAPTLADVAIGLGLPVFPCAWPSKSPAIARHEGGNGFKDATTDATTIRRMFAHPHADLIGMPTGAVSGLVVVDVDTKKGARGEDWLEAHSAALPQTRTHRTMNGGLHLVFEAPPGIVIPCSVGRLHNGVDIRGDGGYVIMPPSRGYAIADATDPAPMPGWLVDAILALRDSRPPPATPAVSRPLIAEGGTRYGLRALQNECDAIRAAYHGTKHDTLNRAAYSIGGLVAAGELAEGEAFADLAAALADMHARQPCDDYRKAQRTLSQAFREGMAKPRQAPPPMAPLPPKGPVHMGRGESNAQKPQISAGFSAKTGPESNTSCAPAAPLPLVYFEDIAPALDARDFVQGLLLEQGAAVVYGESNAGKTFWTTDLALHVASGRAWNGRRVEGGGVAYAVLEGGIGFRNRVAAWRAAQGLDGVHIPFVAIPSGLNLLDPAADTGKLIEALRIAAEVMGAPIKLVVIDTLARAFAGGNENASEDMGALVLNMDRIRAETGAAVLFVHHSGKDQAKGARGHSSLRAAIDTEIEVVAEEGSETKAATVVKQRDLKKGDVFTFRLKVAVIGQNRHGEDVTTCVVEAAEPDNPDNSAPVRMSGDKQIAVRVLRDCLAERGERGFPGVPGDRLSVPEAWWRDRFYARCKPGASADAKQKAFRRAADGLVAAGLVAVDLGRVWEC